MEKYKPVSDVTIGSDVTVEEPLRPEQRSFVDRRAEPGETLSEPELLISEAQRHTDFLKAWREEGRTETELLDWAELLFHDNHSEASQEISKKYFSVRSKDLAKIFSELIELNQAIVDGDLIFGKQDHSRALNTIEDLIRAVDTYPEKYFDSLIESDPEAHTSAILQTLSPTLRAMSWGGNSHLENLERFNILSQIIKTMPTIINFAEETLDRNYHISELRNRIDETDDVEQKANLTEKLQTQLGAMKQDRRQYIQDPINYFAELATIVVDVDRTSEKSEQTYPEGVLLQPFITMSSLEVDAEDRLAQIIESATSFNELITAVHNIPADSIARQAGETEVEYELREQEFTDQKYESIQRLQQYDNGELTSVAFLPRFESSQLNINVKALELKQAELVEWIESVDASVSLPEILKTVYRYGFQIYDVDGDAYDLEQLRTAMVNKEPLLLGDRNPLTRAFSETLARLHVVSN